MRVLGIDTSCDETAVAIVDDGVRIRSNIVASQTAVHEAFAGVVPELASRAHLDAFLPILERALEEASCTMDDVDAIAVTNTPGLVGALLVGLTAAKTLAWLHDKPLVAVNHVEAHLYAARLDEDGPVDPVVGLIASGGHTCLMRADGPTAIELIGSTIDDAAGEAFDKAAAMLGLGFPGGKAIDDAARDGDPTRFDFPRTLLARDSLDFSFSGLKTAVLYAAKGPNARRRAPLLADVRVEDVAASFQRAVVDVLIEKLDRAVRRERPRSVVIGGGVAANRELRARATEWASGTGVALHVPPIALCVDNAAMIAGLGYHHAVAGNVADLELDADPTPIRR